MHHLSSLFVEQWNFHGISTAGYQSPVALWYAGIMHSMDDAVVYEPDTYGIDFESGFSEIDDDYSVVVPDNQIQLTEEEMTILRRQVPDPLYDDGNSGIDLYIDVCSMLSRQSETCLCETLITFYLKVLHVKKSAL